MIKVNKIFSGYGKIDDERYELITYLAYKEKDLYSKTSSIYMGKNFLYKRALELIKSINIHRDNPVHNPNASIPNHTHRKKMNFEKEIEKQVFINNFIFYDDEQFMHVLEINDIKFENIENLINKLKEFKKIAKETKNYDLNINDICNIEPICQYYNFNLQEVIINKISELYYKNNDLLRSIEKKR